MDRIKKQALEDANEFYKEVLQVGETVTVDSDTWYLVRCINGFLETDDSSYLRGAISAASDILRKEHKEESASGETKRVRKERREASLARRQSGFRVFVR